MLFIFRRGSCKTCVGAFGVASIPGKTLHHVGARHGIKLFEVRCAEPAFVSKFSHCSASESSEEFSESSILVAAVAASRFCMNRTEDLLGILPWMKRSHDVA